MKLDDIHVRDIVREWLQKHGYEGLGRPGMCSCRLDNLMPCWRPKPDCDCIRSFKDWYLEIYGNDKEMKQCLTQDSTSLELITKKPCPKCGNTVLELTTEKDKYRSYRYFSTIKCKNDSCGFMFTSMDDFADPTESKLNCIARWNKYEGQEGE